MNKDILIKVQGIQIINLVCLVFIGGVFYFWNYRFSFVLLTLLWLATFLVTFMIQSLLARIVQYEQHKKKYHHLIVSILADLEELQPVSDWSHNERLKKVMRTLKTEINQSSLPL